MENKTEGLITFCVKGFPGTNRSLINLEKTTGLTRHFVLSGSKPVDTDVKFFIDYIKRKRPRVVLFGGWSQVYQFFLKELKNTKIEFGIYWTSSPGQTDISDEIGSLGNLINSSEIKYKLFANKDPASSLSGRLNNVNFLPDTVIFPEELQNNLRNRKKRAIVISLFCSPFEYKRKNILNSLLAVSMLKDRYTLYLNGLSANKSYKSMLEKLKILYRDFDWMSDEDYERVLWDVDLGLQVSFAETFNFVAADHMARRIPVITSRMVPVMDGMPQSITRRLIIEDPDSPFEIKDRIEYLIRNPRMLPEMGKTMYNYLGKENKKRVEIAKNVLRAFTE